MATWRTENGMVAASSHGPPSADTDAVTVAGRMLPAGNRRQAGVLMTTDATAPTELSGVMM